MIGENVVLIETIDSIGTGFLYPCKFDGKTNVQYFVIITNSHVLQGVGIQSEYKGQDYRNQVRVHFYDDLGNKINDNEIEEIRIYNSGCNIDNKDDIAAILIGLKESVLLTIETNVCSTSLENRTILYMEGYPGVMLDDEVSSKVQLQGREKKIFPENREMGIYQIVDDYHWYNDFQDRQLLQGLSGSPVYIEQDGKTMLLGMNQSVSDIHQGENPFKLMYYIKFEYILKHLREANCIIFQKIDEYTYQLEWIYGVLNKNTKEVTLMLVGGSGAGKSSFAKDFAYHGNQLRSTNDGQTTRTKIIYQYSIMEQHPQVEVKFLTQAQFISNMTQNVGEVPIKSLLKRIMNLEWESLKKDNVFLENCYRILEMIYEKEKKLKYPKLLGNIRAIVRGELENKEVIKCYEEITDIFVKKIPIEFIKYIIDSNFINKIQKKFVRGNAKEEVCSVIAALDKTIEKSHSIHKNEVIELIKEYCTNNNSEDLDEKFKEFQKNMLQQVCFGLEQSELYEYSQKLMREEVENKLGDVEFLTSYVRALLSCEGFFYIQEFEQFLEENYIENLLKNMDFKLFIIGDLVSEEEADGENRKKNMHIEIKFLNGITELYKRVYKDIISIIQNKYEKSRTFEFKLNEMDEEKRRLLQKCLQVTKEGSLTGVIDYVKVSDMISDEYAMILKELEIDKLQMIDTCGLDHIEINSKKALKDKLLDNMYYYERETKIKPKDISIIYLKKLDSGKPDELRTILPCVREAIPTAPIYCVFSGIDIFYRSPEEIASICWKKEGDKLPKAVNYILSDKGKLELRVSHNDEKNYDDNIYLVLKNNIISYCGKKGLVRKNFQYYKNNIKYIRKLLASIVMKEYSSLEIIDVTDLENLNKRIAEAGIESIEKETCEGKLVEKIKILLYELFAYASLESSAFRYNTKNADIKSYKRNSTTGYWGTYRHQLNQLFHESYSEVIMKESLDLLEFFKTSKGAVKAALKNMESKYLGDRENLANVDLAVEKKNTFRKILEEMYATQEYKYNPFKKDIGDEQIQEQRDLIFNDIFNLRKGLNNDGILNKFVKEFLICLEKQINEDNSVKSENMLKLNEDFTKVLASLKCEYIEKYELSNNEQKIIAEDKFWTMMEYWCKKNKR